MQFTHLHVHSHYSLLDGLAKIDQILDACQELKMTSIALTDHGSMYGAVEFFQKAKKRDMRPIIGNEVYLAPNGRHLRRPNIDDKRYHLVLLVKNKEGYRNLVKLTSKSYLEGFYYKPRVDKELLREHSAGLIALTACINGEVPRAIINGRPDEAEKIALEYQEIFGKENFYLELEYNQNIKEQFIANDGLIKIAKKYQIPLVATNDVHYIRKEDAVAQDVLMAIQTDKKVTNENRLTMKDNDFSLQSQEQMIEWFRETPEAIDNTQKIAEQCNFEFKLGETKLPHFEVPSGQTPEEYLENMSRQGLKKRYGENPNKETTNRLDYELNVIKQTGFSSYFLIVQDFINWAKSNGIVCGPGRGSAAGSLVAYLTNITDVDPIKYNLLFERFLNPERIELPDIDLDFADDRRDKVIDYVREKYGEDHVAQIITFGTMAARAAVRDVGRAMDYPYSFCDQIAKLIPFGLTLEKAIHESQELHQLYKTDQSAKKLIDMARQLEGVARHASTHAAGVVITKENINNLVPRQHPTQNDQTIVTQYEMHSIEALGLLKMDFLGLKTLTVIQNTLNRIKESSGQEIILADIPLDDQETFELFREANSTGVFQMESSGMKRYLKQLKPTQFEDIMAMVALYRPGPMEFIPEFIARKHGRKKIKYLHPKLKPILENSYGICVYQEQLMRIARDLAGFTLSEADVLRKAVSKKIKKLLDEQKDKMIEGMTKNEIEKETAEKIWQFVEPFARYGFNRAHSCCYATIGYWTAYLKSHYPAEFMSALMTSEQNDIERIAFLVDECRQMNIEILPPNINESDENFAVIDKTKIRFGLKAIKNVGHNVVQTIVSERKNFGQFESIDNFLERVQSKDLNKKSLESLIKCGALDNFGERGQLLASVEQMLNLAREIQKIKKSGQISLFADQPSIQTSSFKLQEAPTTNEKEYLTWEKELLGLYVSRHPLENYKKEMNFSAIPFKDLSTKLHGDQQVTIGGIINKIKKINTKAGQPMLFVGLEDLSGKMEVIVFPGMLERTADAWQEDRIILVSGRLSERGGRLNFLANTVKVIG